jgi:hydroxyethylthiazole kinase-like sugar kinase family protein
MQVVTDSTITSHQSKVMKDYLDSNEHHRLGAGIWKYLVTADPLLNTVRSQKPLIHNITSYVVNEWIAAVTDPFVVACADVTFMGVCAHEAVLMSHKEGQGIIPPETFYEKLFDNFALVSSHCRITEKL